MSSAATRKWRAENKEKMAEQHKKYLQTEEGYRAQKISRWKTTHKMKLRENEDWISVYYYVESQDTCEDCGNLFKSRRDRQLDHDHTTGYIRNVVCNSCNTRRGYEDAK